MFASFSLPMHILINSYFTFFFFSHLSKISTYLLVFFLSKLYSFVLKEASHFIIVSDVKKGGKGNKIVIYPKPGFPYNSYLTAFMVYLGLPLVAQW